MNRYEMEIAKLENRTPRFYYPYSVKAKSDYAKNVLAIYFRNSIRLYAVTKEELAQVDEKMKEFSGEYVFHYNDPKETESARKEQVRTGALNKLGDVYIFPPGPGAKGIIKSGDILTRGKDFEIYVGDRVDIQQPKKLTFDDLPDLMGIEKEIKSFEGVES